MSFVDYLDADGNVHPVSALSLVVLSARNSNQIRTVRLEAIRAGLPYADFTESMTKDTFVEQITGPGLCEKRASTTGAFAYSASRR
jgi:hypothetical protein